ncbi:3-deoxy-8-phosphooctulonate synthase [Bartonella sp. TP]|uniref:3-deoxy-8-phosphooctulonate synthase n=1 Tax=Bartonella sp. TP TaxID=3057550 RepID=UPI0025B01536|nr:3-deoxy-8-phosphooctulonate synthase [Bartonella sp. TP]WJW80097.1 3-deoxy-8-phosphooctulonate synthase [Bartonella sp. TP]
MLANVVNIGGVTCSNKSKLMLIAGPCQIESKQHSFDMAGILQNIAKKLDIGLVYKSSFDKANRTSLNSQRGVGLEQGLAIFEALKAEFNIPIITDVHLPEQCAEVAEIVDVLQIPAFLCRQTDLLVAAAQTGRVINVKKGQFLAPWDMKHVVEKLVQSGNSQVLLTERGTCFGYNRLITDMRALSIMAEFGTPIIFDATHSVQMPGGLDGSSGGERGFVASLARAAVAVGVAGVFLETHQDPDLAPSDGPNMIKLQDLPFLLEELLEYDKLAKGRHLK